MVVAGMTSGYSSASPIYTVLLKTAYLQKQWLSLTSVSIWGVMSLHKAVSGICGFRAGLARVSGALVL